MNAVLRAVFPWSAVVGQDALKHALLLCAIDPAIGGVLVHGPRGVAKTTAARALGELIQGPFVELPLGATEERVTGSLDLARVLNAGEVQFAPGLLARAHQGVLYVDEVNLLPDMLVDVLLDAAASGQNVVERDGVSHTHPARFVLVGTMNPEEGQLRPQLIDRFGLSVRAASELAPSERAEIVTRRLAFDHQPEAFRARFEAAQQELSARCRAARALAETIPLSGPALGRVTELCHAAGVEGVRADLAMLRAARAHAAWHARDAITAQDVDAVAELALAHRRHPSSEPEAGGGPAQGGRPSAAGASSPRGPAGASSRTNESDVERARNANEQHNSSSAADGVGRRDATSDASGETAKPTARTAADDATARTTAASSNGTRATRGYLPAVPVSASAALRLPNWLTTASGRRPEPTRRGAARLAAASGTRGPLARAGAIDWFSTFTHCRQPRRRSDLRRRTRRSQAQQLWIVALDCSASMLRGAALAIAKGIAHAIETRALQAGAHLALISFRNHEARLEITSRPGRAAYAASVASLAGGGGTPIEQALHEAFRLAHDRRWRAADVQKRLFLLTDGRTREALALAHAVPIGMEVTLIDCERTTLRLGRAPTIARNLGARYVHVDDLATPRSV